MTRETSGVRSSGAARDALRVPCSKARQTWQDPEEPATVRGADGG